MKMFAPTIRIKWAEIETTKTADEWMDEFINWIESRNETCCSVVEPVTVVDDNSGKPKEDNNQLKTGESQEVAKE